ncbi:MAG TPA: sigma-70 family RNA polymerase sigma factor [Acidimicrobiales bacterium]|nr:sigma-70 family RNA polymerase sigma factor [Acidimicrobiales bacterium]
MGEGAEAVWADSVVTLYRARYLPMVRLAFLLTGSNELAEEIVQEAFIRLRDRADVADLPSYLRATVVNACRDHHRRAGARTRALVRLAPVEITVDAVDELHDALARLPARQRAVIVLRYYEGLSEAEIAGLLGCRPGTVKSLAHRGLGVLRGVVER